MQIARQTFKERFQHKVYHPDKSFKAKYVESAKKIDIDIMAMKTNEDHETAISKIKSEI